MSYTVLARKLRPDRFSALVGQDHVVRALIHGLDHDRLHHAYLFTGTRGVGKTTIARILAKSLNCEKGVSSDPCGECSRCREVAENRFVDLIEVDAASRTGVDDTRELLENAQYMPTAGRYKVYLIDEVHMLSKHAFNALLKTLEEPPEHVKFLLATTDPKKVPVTVLSRCLQFQLKNLAWDAISTYLTKVLADEGIASDEQALELIARAARGSMRDALSLTDQAIAYGQGSVSGPDVATMLGAVGRDEVGALMAALSSGEASQVLPLVSELAGRSADFEEVLGGLIEAFHRLAVQLSLGEAVESDFSAEQVQLNYQIGVMGLRDLQVVPDPRLGFEMTLLRMLAFAPAPIASASSPAQPTTSTKKGATGSGATSPSAASAGAKAESSRPNRLAAATPSAQPMPQPAIDKPAPVAKSLGQKVAEQQPWFNLASELSLSGVARMLVNHCWCLNPEVIGTQDGNELRLMLDVAHDMLLSDQQVQTVERAVQAQLARTIQVTMTTGTAQASTPAERNAQLAAAKQSEAEQSLKSDTTVQSLVAEFDARVEKVTPIDEAFPHLPNV